MENEKIIETENAKSVISNNEVNDVPVSNTEEIVDCGVEFGDVTVSDVNTEKVEKRSTDENSEQCVENNEENTINEVAVVVAETQEIVNVDVLDASEKQEMRPKKRIWKKLLCFIGGGLLVAVVAFVVVFFTVIKPNNIYNDAVVALENSNFEECQQLIDKIPKHKDVPALQEKLTYALAEDALKNGDFQECERLMGLIPNYSKIPTLRKELTYAKAEKYTNINELDSAISLLLPLSNEERAMGLLNNAYYLKANQYVEMELYDDAKTFLNKLPNGYYDPYELYNKIDYADAFAALEKGDYKTAYNLFNKLGNFKDSAKQKKTVYYEALAFKSIFQIQDLLKDPSSLRVTKVTFYKHPSTTGELNLLIEFTGTNSYGGRVSAYGGKGSVYKGTGEAWMIDKSSYNDPDDYIDALYVLLVDGIKAQTVFSTSVDITRMNRLLTANVNFNINLPFSTTSGV